MSVNTLNNPYEKGTIVHQQFDTSLSHFNRLSDQQLCDELKSNQSRAMDNNTYDFDQMDHFERECRAIETVMESRA